MNNNITIAVDGYSSCGKSTVAKALARELKFVYIDSGAMYRAVTYYFLEHNINIDDTLEVETALNNIHIDLQNNADKTAVILNGKDITSEIRGLRISDAVSTVGTIKAVRTALVNQQRNMGKQKSIVMDGRDIGSVVFPDAQVKIFMTADPKIRAERRYLELKAAGQDVDLDHVFKNIALRDHQDTTRKESPLVRAEDAIILDNTNLTEKEQLAIVIAKVGEHCPKCVKHLSI